VEQPFIAQAVAQVTARPRKLAYLIQAGRADQFRKAVLYASTEWGGLAHPIVPVRKLRRIDPGMWQILEQLSPEVFIDYLGIDSGLQAEIQRRLGAQVLSEAALAYDEPGVHVLVTLPSGSLRGRTLFEVPPKATIAYQAAIGVIPADSENAKLWAETGATRQPTITAMDLLDAQLDVPSALWATRQEFRTYSSQSFGGPVVIYCDRRPSLRRLIGFWNVRALATATDTYVLWLPSHQFSSPGVNQRIRELCLNKRQTVPDLLLLGDEKVDLDEAAHELGFALDTGTKWSVTLGLSTRDLDKTPLSYRVRIDPRQFVLGDRKEGTRTPVPVTVIKPVTLVHFESPVRFNPLVSGKVRIDIEGIEPIEWPRRRLVAQLVSDSASWTVGGLGLVLRPESSYRIPLRVPEPSVVLDACLAESGWTWSISDKGRYARALVGAVPGRISIDSLHDRMCLRVIRALGSLTSRKAAQVLQASLPTSVQAADVEAAVAQVMPALVPRWLTANEIASALGSTGPRTRRDSVVSALTRLLDDYLVVRAFRFQCTNCGLTTHIPLERAADHVRCDGCTLGATLLGGSGEPDLTYGLNSLLDRAADQDCHGHLPVQDWMLSNLGLRWSVPGADLTSSTGAKRELDVLGVSHTQVVVAEVKNAANAFTAPVITDAADLARQLEADHLVLAALNEWRGSTKAEALALAQAKIANVSVIGLSDLVQT
jgi:hypothetical protein